jgi:hypothetical protein
MSLKPTGDPDERVLKQGGGCFVLFGLPFFLGGVMVWLAMLGVLNSEDSIPWYFGLPFGGVFVAVGLGFMLGRSGLRINTRDEIVEKWYGLLVPMKTTTYHLGAFDRVTLDREIRRSDKSTYTVFPVRLQGADDPVDIEEPRKEDEGRASAEELAKFLNLPLYDGTAGEVKIRRPEHLDESIKEKARRTGEVTELPDPPASLASVITPSGDAVTIEVPPPGFNIGTIIQIAAGFIFPAIVIGVFLLPILTEDDMPPQMKAIFGGFIGVFFVLLPLLSISGTALARSRASSRVTVSPREVRLEERRTLRTVTTEIPAGEIEEVFAGRPEPNQGKSLKFLGVDAVVTVRSDNQTIRFGTGLDRDEVQYLTTLTKAVLTV